MNERRRWTEPKYTIPTIHEARGVHNTIQVGIGYYYRVLDQMYHEEGEDYLGRSLRPDDSELTASDWNTWLDLSPHLSCYSDLRLITRPEPAPAWRRRRRLMPSKLLLLTKKP